jgi:bifunctional non-homologous end joining protein LigD
VFRTQCLPVVEPMHPWRAREPFHRQDWVYERKEGGWRMLAYKDGGRVRLVSRRGRDHTARFAELTAALACLSAATLILDGEVCVFDANLVSQFHLLADERHGEVATPPVFIAFDCLHAGGRDLRALPLCERREHLQHQITGARLVYSSMRLDGNGFEAWSEVKQRGWEGMVAKDAASRYVGGRSRFWQKVKVRREGRFVVIGFDANDGATSSLLLAARKGSALTYVGRVEWGVSRGAVERIATRCTPRRTPPCGDAERTRGVSWVEPRVVVEVSFSELMVGRLRDPVLRVDSIK